MKKTINYSSNGKRDLHNLENEFDNAFDSLDNETWKFENNKQIIIKYLNDCRRGKAKSGGINKRISKGTLYRVMGILRLLSEVWIKKDFEKTNQKDWDNFYNNMEDNILKNAFGKKYKPSTKAKNYKTIRKFLKWKFGDNKVYPKFCDDWVCTEERITKEFLTRSEIEKLIKGINKISVKTYIMMLFDGGFRIEELSNLRWSDVQKPEGKKYYQAFIRKETSKTKKERHVSLWLATDLIDIYKNTQKNKLKNEFSESDFLFLLSYGGFYKTIKRAGERILNKKISPHTLRHSSATYYSKIIKTYQNFCSRYGWTLRSSTPQRYFHAIADDEIAEQCKEHEIARFKTEFEKYKLINEQLRGEIEKMKFEQKGVVEQIVNEVLKKIKN